MDRRRGIISAQGETPPPSEWDSVWTYEDGLPTVAGWTRDKTGGTCSIVTQGLSLINNTFSLPTEIAKGVVEAKFVVRNERVSSNVRRGILRIGNATNSIYVVLRSYPAGTHKIRIWDTQNINNATEIGTFALGSEYVIRIEINGSVGAVYVNGDLAKDNIDTTSMYSPGTLLFGDNEQYGGGEYWQYVKYKKIA